MFNNFLIFFIFIFTLSHASLENFPGDFKLISTQIISDVSLDKDEILYLIDLYPGQLINKKRLENAAFYLTAKNIFRKIRFVFEDGANGKYLKLYVWGKWQLGSVHITGNIRGKDKFYKKYMQDIGSTLSIRKCSLALKKIKRTLYKQGFFAAQVSNKIFLQAKHKTGKIIVDIKRGKQFSIADIHVDTLLDVSMQQEIEQQLMHELINKKFSYKRMHAALQRVQLVLQQKGFLNSTIDAVLEKNTDKHTVRLGVRLTIPSSVRICVEGMQFFSNEHLLKKLVQHYVDLPIYLIVDQLKKYYERYGFFGTSIDVVEREQDSYLLNIHEGVRSIIKRIQCHDAQVSGDALHAFSSLINNYYDKEAFDRAQQQFLAICAQQGYYDTTIEAVEIHPIHDGIEITLKVDYGQQSVLRIDEPQRALVQQDMFGKIIMSGNVHVPFCKFINELSLGEHDLFDKTAITQAFHTIKDLGIYESASIMPSTMLDPNGLRPLIIKGVNHSTFEIKARAGYQQVSNLSVLDNNSRSTYRLGGGFVIKNPLECGDTLKFDTDFTIFYRHITAQYVLPFLFKVPIRTIFRVYANKFLQPLYLGSNEEIYEIYQNGGLVAFKYNNIPHVSFDVATGINFFKITGLSRFFADLIGFSDYLVDKPITYFFIEPTIFYEKVDSKINPRKGMYGLASLRAQATHQYTNVNYARLLVESSFFHPITESMVFASRIRFGNIFTNCFTSILPSERFYLGGSNSIRSYNPDFAPPLAFFLNKQKELQAIPVGGQSMFNANLELRFSLYGAFSGVFFQDLGFLKNPHYQTQLLTATGFGLRYNTPIGPIRFDIGFRPKHQPNDKNFAWFLTIGQAF